MATLWFYHHFVRNLGEMIETGPVRKQDEGQIGQPETSINQLI